MGEWRRGHQSKSRWVGTLQLQRGRWPAGVLGGIVVNQVNELPWRRLDNLLSALRVTFCGGSVRDQGGATRAPEPWSTCLALSRCRSSRSVLCSVLLPRAATEQL